MTQRGLPTFSRSSHMVVTLVSLTLLSAHVRAALARGRSSRPSPVRSAALNRAVRVALLTDRRFRYWSSRACMRGSAGRVPAFASCSSNTLNEFSGDRGRG